ncbi:TetR/AcrR family transcriptional regulator [Actinacidiphila alni]|uniref:TetR/AcrR family transcriptional regulator n=1 Tax=Actinacidiphila alni TaxID=380248 RepID=UPI0034542C0D
MTSGRDRLIEAATRLLTESPDREPSNRELCDAAGVAAPSLYHHFGTKEGLLDAVVDRAFGAYLKRKRGMLRTGDLVADFAAGWDLHIEFGVQNPVLYALMYGTRATSSAARTADARLRKALHGLRDAGLLRTDVDTAAAMTTAMAVGCVTQLNRERRRADDPFATAMRSTLLETVTGLPASPAEPEFAARALVAHLEATPEGFTAPERALFQQWLRSVADNTRTVQDGQHQ